MEAMTVIVGSLIGREYSIGGDSGAFEESGDLKYTSAVPKVFKIGNWLLGGAGSFRVLNALAKLQVGNPEAVRDILLKELAGDNSEWSILFISPAGIFELSEDYGIIQHRENYCAIGSGAGVATGALAALHSYLESPKEIVRETLEVTARHSLYCEPPFKVLHSKI